MKNYILRAIEMLIEASYFPEREELGEREKRLKHENPKDLLREYHTIRVGSSRRAGHTTAMFEFIEKHKCSKFFVISKNLQMSKYIKGSAQIRGIDDRIIFGSLGTIKNMVGYNSPDYVFIDCACLFSDDDMKSIYDWLEIYCNMNREMRLILLE